MKRLAAIFLTVITGIFVVTVSACYAFPVYEFEDLQSNSYFKHAPQISDNGWITWEAGKEIYLFDRTYFTGEEGGGELYPNIINISETGTFFVGDPQINANGDIVWHGTPPNHDAYEIFFYNGATREKTMLTNDSHKGPFFKDEFPQINNNRNVVWRGGNFFQKKQEIYYCNNPISNPSTITNISNTTNSDINPQINDGDGNDGNVVWVNLPSGEIWGDGEIYLDGTQISGSGYDFFDGHSNSSNSPQINNNGELVWAQDAGSGDDRGYQIFYYDSNTSDPERITPTDDDIKTSFNPQITDNGYVVWEGTDGSSERDIFLYNTTTEEFTKITDNDVEDRSPQTNGEYVVWKGYGDGTDYEIFLYDIAGEGTIAEKTLQLTDNSWVDQEPQINANGEITWIRYYGENNTRAIMLAKPVPEPASLLLFGSGLLGVWGFRRKKKNKKIK